MKANAPEKLYITNDEKRFSDKCHSASTEKYVDNDIEYIRKDAFIEKAINWLKEQKEMVGISFQEDFIERFKNYMEGE
jgi:hypothetical protein